MCKAVEDYGREMFAEGYIEGVKEGTLETVAIRMLKDNVPLEKIAYYTRLSLEMLQELKETLNFK